MTPTSPIETLLLPRTRDLGDGFTVRRALPSRERPMVGPFVFFDQMGPAALREGGGLDVRPHPHIGLATVTYLFEGAILHRDSLGSVQRIEPGAVNWMTAGRGIVHSERSPADERHAGRRLSGIQVWVALPRQHEETEPSFAHHPAETLPVVEERGVRMRLMVGHLSGLRAPVATLSEMFYADVVLEDGAVFTLGDEHEERGAYVVEGGIEVGAAGIGAGEMPIFQRAGEVALRATGPTRVLLFGGASMDGPRHLVWNFVSSSAARIAAAKEDWRARRFPEVPGEVERIPLPDGLPAPVDYP